MFLPCASDLHRAQRSALNPTPTTTSTTTTAITTTTMTLTIDGKPPRGFFLLFF